MKNDPAGLKKSNIFKKIRNKFIEIPTSIKFWNGLVFLELIIFGIISPFFIFPILLVFGSVLDVALFMIDNDEGLDNHYWAYVMPLTIIFILFCFIYALFYNIFNFLLEGLEKFNLWLNKPKIIKNNINPKRELKSIISTDEIDDQFLRLKEILNCDIVYKYCKQSEISKYASNPNLNLIKNWFFSETCQDISLSKNLKKSRGFYIISISFDIINNYNPKGIKKDKDIEKINEEVEQIKVRMESMFQIKFKILNLNEIVIY